MRITKLICDDCEKEITKENSQTISNKDICIGCLNIRIKHSFKQHPKLYKKCNICNGKGYIKEFTGVGNDYESVNCQKCDKKGKICVLVLTN